MSRVISPVSGKPYGLAAVCRAWRLARSGVYRHQRTMLQPQRRGPLGAMSDDGLTAAIQGVLAASPFHGEGHRKVWARLRYAETRTSLRRVLRLMRQNNLLAPTRVGSPRGPRNHDGTIIPAARPARQGSLAASEEGVVPAGERRRRDAQLARDRLQVFSAQQPQHRRSLALSRHPATAAERRYARLSRSLRVTRPRSNNVRFVIHGTPLVRKSSACEVSQSTVMRGNSRGVQQLLPNCGLSRLL